MSLSDLASVGSFVSGFAVLVSLIYLSQQTRQNTKHTRALIQQGRAVQSTDLPLRWAEDASLADIYFRGLAGDPTLDDVEAARFLLTLTSVFWYFEDQFHQHGNGMVEDNRYAGTVTTLRLNFQDPGFRVAWKQMEYLYGSAFRIFMNGVMQEVSVATGPGPVASWKAAVVAERSGTIA